MRPTIVLLFLAILLSTSHARFDVFNPIQLLRPRSAASGLRDEANITSCPSWRLTVETHNHQGKNNLVPRSCVDYVREYMLGGQYRDDCEEMANVAVEYAKSVKPAADGKDVWVFDVDKTLLSNLPYYQRPDVQYGSLESNITEFFYEWVVQWAAAAVPGMLRLYNTAISLGFKTFILTGSPDSYNDIRATNLNKAAYANWQKIIAKGKDYKGISTPVFKSDQRTKLVKQGYRIVGNVGDQWSDLTGDNVGNRTFKVPNPMYYA